MTHSTVPEQAATISFDGKQHVEPPLELLVRYEDLLRSRRFNWTSHPKLLRVLGQGGQGIVFFSQRNGADGFSVPYALKVFSPERYESVGAYGEAMSRIARVAARVALIQHDHLLEVQDFYDRNHIRIMAMEWVDGFDLRRLLDNRILDAVEQRVRPKRWHDINRILLTRGPVQPRLTPGLAVTIVRDCLGALAALHREGIVHGDIKPGNIMLKATGRTKIIDIGSAFESNNPPEQRACTPTYAAPEVLEGEPATPSSDLASLGYVLLELLTGHPLFAQATKVADLLEEKRALHGQLENLLPPAVTCNELLMNFCRRLIDPDPKARYTSAQDAELQSGGAAAFLRQLVMGNLGSEYAHEIHLLLQEVKLLGGSSVPPASPPPTTPSRGSK